MNVYEPSTFDHNQLGPVVRLTQILLNVHERVSSLKSSSIKPSIGSLDKLIFHLVNKFSVSSLREVCQREGLNIRGLNLQDKKYYLRISEEKKFLDVLLGNPYNTEFWKIILNPKNFNSPEDVESFALRIFGASVLDAKMYRADFAIDLFEDFNLTLEGLMFDNKTAHSEWVGGSSRTGLYVGTNDDKYLAYNKGLKEKVDYPWTRIERQVSGTKLPFRKFSEFRGAFNSIEKFDPLSTVHLSSVIFTEGPLSPEEQIRLQELKTLIKHEGIFQTQKKLNASRNFRRDYGKLFQLVPRNQQPKQIFDEFIKDFYKEHLWSQSTN